MLQKLYHGGRAGLKKGQFILPPIITRAKSMAEFGNHVCDRSKVYVTTNYTAAAMYAAGSRNGEIYEVEAMGELQPDPDCTMSGLSYACDKARVLRVHKLSRHDREMILYALTAA